MHRYKYKCDSCGFTCKSSHASCPTCHNGKMVMLGTKFRMSSKKRKNPERIEKGKRLNSIINGNNSSYYFSQEYSLYIDKERKKWKRKGIINSFKVRFAKWWSKKGKAITNPPGRQIIKDSETTGTIS